MNKKNELSNLNSEEKEIFSKFLGLKLAILIDELDLSDDAKELLVNLLPTLSEKDLLKFTRFLEEKYVSEATDILDIELENELEKLNLKYASQQKKVNDSAKKKIQNLF